MQQRKTVPIITLLAATLLATALVVAAAQGGNTLEATVVIGTNAQGNCVVTTSPAKISGAKRNFKVVWHVTNNCGQTRTVSVGNFTLRTDNKKKDPVRLDDPPQIPAGQTRDLEGRIKVLPRSDWGTYKYDILIDGTVAEDPELEVDG